MSELSAAPLESNRRSEGFKIYCRLQNKAEVARSLDISKTLVYKWAREDQWDTKLAELRNKLGVYLQFKEELVKDSALRAMAGDLDVLTTIQEIAVDAFLQLDLRPKNFNEFLKAMDFVLKHKQRILSFVKDKTPSNGQAATAPPNLLGTDDIQRHMQSAIANDDNPRS